MDPGLSIIDARPLAAYNGWRMRGEARGGHLPGAIAFPVGWLDRLDDEAIHRLLVDKGAFDGGGIAVYGWGHEDAGRVAARLRSLGATGVAVHGPGFAALAADLTVPLEELPRCTELVHVAWLRALLDGAVSEAPPNPRWSLFHVDFGGPEAYEQGHIPGAFHLDTDLLEDPDDWDCRDPQALHDALSRLGIAHDSTVILYGRDLPADAAAVVPGRRAGQLAAVRALLLLRYAGVQDVRLLDGGFDRWVDVGHPIETVSRRPDPIRSFGAEIPGHPELLVDVDGAREILADPDGAVLVSVRSWAEHVGQTSGYATLGQVGRIPGDVWGNAGSDAYHMEHYRTIENTMRPYPEIAANWASVGITPDRHVAFYCGTGWRASEAWFYARLQGWPRIAVYDGGWLDWSRDPDRNPIAVGEP